MGFSPIGEREEEGVLTEYSLNPLMISTYKPVTLLLFLSCGTMFVYFIV